MPPPSVGFGARLGLCARVEVLGSRTQRSDPESAICAVCDARVPDWCRVARRERAWLTRRERLPGVPAVAETPTSAAVERQRQRLAWTGARPACHPWGERVRGCVLLEQPASGA